MTLLKVILIIINVVMNSLASILLKISANHKYNGFLGLIINPYFLSGLFVFGLSFLAYNIVLKYMNVNIAYPIVVSGSIIMVVLLSKIFLNENINYVQLSGVFIILFGVIILMVGGLRV